MARPIAAFLVVLTACPIGLPACAQSANKTMVAGGTLRLGHYASANPDCSSKGRTIVRVSNAPAHGMVLLRSGKDFSHFPSLPQCNAVRVEGVTAQYRSQRGYIGTDTVELDIIYPSGNERTESFNITVK